MIINDLDDYYIVFDTKNRNTELDTLITYLSMVLKFVEVSQEVNELLISNKTSIKKGLLRKKNLLSSQ